MEKQRIIERLKTFNNVVDEIKNYSFLKSGKSKKIGFEIFSSYGRRKAKDKTKFFGPKDESISAFVLHYRKFIQDKEDVSFKNMGNIYKQSPIEKTYYERYKLIIKKIDEIFSKPANVTSDIHAYIIREIHDIFIKGNLAHIQENHGNRKLYLEIIKDPVKKVIFKRFLVNTLLETMNQLIAIKKLNEEVLEGLIME